MRHAPSVDDKCKCGPGPGAQRHAREARVWAAKAGSTVGQALGHGHAQRCYRPYLCSWHRCSSCRQLLVAPKAARTPVQGNRHSLPPAPGKPSPPAQHPAHPSWGVPNGRPSPLPRPGRSMCCRPPVPVSLPPPPRALRTCSDRRRSRMLRRLCTKQDALHARWQSLLLAGHQVAVAFG